MRSGRRGGAPHQIERGMHHADISGVAHELADREDAIEQRLRAAQILLLDG
jgi:hypothetical protein